MTRCTLLAVGSRGDVEPIAALAVGLKRAGFETTLATHALFEPLARRLGLGFRAIEGNPREVLDSPAGQAWLHETRGRPIKFIVEMEKLVRPMLERMLTSCMAAVQDSEFLLYTTLAPGFHLAEWKRIPSMLLQLQPSIGRTREYPTVFFSTDKSFGGWVNWLSHFLAEAGLWWPIRKSMNAWRGTLGLPSLGWGSPLAHTPSRPLRSLLGYSPAVFARPGDWPADFHVTGYWQLARQVSVASSDLANSHPRIVDFIRSGAKPIYVGFGSMRIKDPTRASAAIREAIKTSKVRALISPGWGGLSAEMFRDVPEVLIVDDVPHAQLFEQVAAVVHHGGAGTTATALHAGVPQIVVPFFADQPFWGQRVAELGAGAAPIPLSDLSAENLAGALQSVANPKIRGRCEELAATLAKEDGVARATEIVQAVTARIPAT